MLFDRWKTRRHARRVLDDDTLREVLRSHSDADHTRLLRLTGLTPRRMYAALGRLEDADEVVWRYPDGPRVQPRRRLYRLTSSTRQ